MASKFWVGGGSSTNWNAVTNTNWSDTDGGANNATAPGVGDKCIFNGNSGSGTSVLNAAFAVQALNCTGFTGTLNHSAFTLTINTASVDSLILSSTMTYSPTNANALILFTNTSGNADVTSNGKRLAALNVNAVGGTVRLLDALRVDTVSASVVTLTAGTFNGNTFPVDVTTFVFSNSNTRVLQLGDGTWTLGANAANSATVWNGTTITGLTFTKGASNIVVATNGLSGSRSFIGNALTYNNLTIDANSARGLFSVVIAGATFNQLNVGAGNTIGLPFGTTTVSTAPTWTGTTAAPILIEGGSVGSASTLSIPSGTLTLTNGGVRDITGSGGASFVANNSFDFGNNTGWAITPPSSLTAADIRAAVGLASANLDTQLTTIDDFLDTEVAAIKAKTDSLTFTVAGQVDSNIQSVNDVTVNGNGAGTKWGP